ncbi:glycosyltransferase [Marinobacter hydrocarbonoclasticus]|nr:glycosyltransferase [Marinobacter nauticus]
MKPTLLIFGEDWDRHPSSTQHLMKELMSSYRLVWVNSIGLRRPGLQDLGRLKEKLLAPSVTRKSTTPLPSDMEVIAPRVWPLAQSPLIRALNRRILAWQLRHVGKVDLIWCSLPSAEQYLDLFPGVPVVYYCGDDFGALSGVDHRRTLSAERRLAERADWIFTVSERLLKRFDPAKSELLRHGVDLRMFSEPRARPSDLPDGLVLGYYGSLNEWLDYGLLDRIAQTFPDANLVLVGPNMGAPDSLLARVNVHWLGARPHAALPAYAQHFDVALLPFLLNEQILACDPLKLREYLAAGCTVVSTDFPAAARYQGYVALNHSPSAFIQSIRNCLKLRRERSVLRKLVANESWNLRASKANERLQRLRPSKCEAI